MSKKLVKKTVTIYDTQINQIKDFIDENDKFEVGERDFSRALRYIIKQFFDNNK
jgi:hypothetical protein